MTHSTQKGFQYDNSKSMSQNNQNYNHSHKSKSSPGFNAKSSQNTGKFNQNFGKFNQDFGKSKPSSGLSGFSNLSQKPGFGKDGSMKDQQTGKDFFANRAKYQKPSGQHQHLAYGKDQSAPTLGMQHQDPAQQRR